MTVRWEEWKSQLKGTRGEILQAQEHVKSFSSKSIVYLTRYDSLIFVRLLKRSPKLSDPKNYDSSVPETIPAEFQTAKGGSA